MRWGHLDPAVLTFVLLDIDGAVVPHAKLRMPAGPPERVISAIAEQVHILMQEGVILEAPVPPQCRDLPLRGALQAATGKSVLMPRR